MKEKIKNFMDAPLTIRRELKFNVIAFEVLFGIPAVIALIVGLANYRKVSKKDETIVTTEKTEG